MLNQKLLFAGLIIASIMSAPNELSAADIVIVASDQPLQWDPKELSVKVGDVLHFVFGAAPESQHGITTRSPGDKAKVQIRGKPGEEGQILQELGEGPSQFDVTLTPSKPNQEITQLKVLPTFPPTFRLMCSFHRGAMVITLARSD